MRMRRWMVVGAVLSACGLAGAQDAGPPVVQSAAPAVAPSGTVTGRVIAQDTQQPARFVSVMLQSIATAASDGDGPRFGSGGGVNVRTDAEGQFTATNVAPGDYYVTAGAAGYVPERALLQAAIAAGADPANLLAAIPQVHVDASGATSVTVTMERGATISGKVVWEDGSPAAGVSMNAVATAAAVPLPGALQAIQSPGGGSGFASTDDRGAFRIAGLAAGEYLLRTVIQSPTQQGGVGRGFQMASPIRVYSPGVFRRADAKTVVVKVGEERSDVRVVIDLRALRTVSGHVGSATSGQSVASGRVTLSDPNDKDLQLYGSIAANGDFAVRYVPAGNYTLQVAGASTQSGGNRRRDSDAGGVSFQPFSQPVVVGDRDVTGVGITLTPVPAQP
jgi:hypothetical protein